MGRDPLDTFSSILAGVLTVALVVAVLVLVGWALWKVVS